MNGVAHDNATRYLLKQVGQERRNDYASLFDGIANHGCDFVWNGVKVRVAAGFTSGGHPALAGFDQVQCAGRIMEDYFFFHSGHYHPKKINALYFMANFVENSCQSIDGERRDRTVAELCRMKLRIYADYSETEIFNTTFETEAEPEETVSSSEDSEVGSPPFGYKKSAPVSIGQKGASIPIGQKSAPRPTGKARAAVLNRSPIEKPRPVPASSLVEDLGITPIGLYFEKTKQWVPDSERDKCALCNKEFTTLRRKHHCRQCGDIFCDDCSKGKKVVAKPARNASKTVSTDKPERVCKTCQGLVQLI